MKNSILILLFFIFLFTASCKKEGTPLSQLPKLTTEGRNTFGCLVDGEVWTPAGPSPSGGTPRLDVHYDEHNKFLRVGAKREISENSINQRMVFGNFINGVGEFNLAENLTFTDYISCGFYYLDTLSPRTINISCLNTSENIVSGTFQFTVIHFDCQDTIRVTEGRFDTKYW